MQFASNKCCPASCHTICDESCSVAQVWIGTQLVAAAVALSNRGLAAMLMVLSGLAATPLTVPAHQVLYAGGFAHV